jgi:tetratricopeptide (TPR) repeat protein
MQRLISLLALFWCGVGLCTAASPLTLAPGTETILDHIYSGRTDVAISEAQQMQQKLPAHPLGYLLEAEALWWRIWCSSAEFKYGMNMPRHREKLVADQHYLDLSTKALTTAQARLKEQESAEMHFYAGMAEALSSRLFGLRGEYHNTARFGVRARENFTRALALDPELADADMGLGLYDYYVDTLSTMARMMRFFMGIPGGSKGEGIQLLYRAIREGQLTPVIARFYLAVNLHNYDQRYQEALQVLTPLVEKYPDNPLFLLAEADLLAKLGKKSQATDVYRAAGVAAQKVEDPPTQRKIEVLVQQSIAALGSPHRQQQ